MKGGIWQCSIVQPYCHFPIPCIFMSVMLWTTLRLTILSGYKNAYHKQTNKGPCTGGNPLRKTNRGTAVGQILSSVPLRGVSIWDTSMPWGPLWCACACTPLPDGGCGSEFAVQSWERNPESQSDGGEHGASPVINSHTTGLTPTTAPSMPSHYVGSPLLNAPFVPRARYINDIHLGRYFSIPATSASLLRWWSLCLCPVGPIIYCIMVYNAK